MFFLLGQSGVDTSEGLVLARDINLAGAKEFSYMTLDQIREKLRQVIFGSCSYYEVLSGRVSTLHWKTTNFHREKLITFFFFPFIYPCFNGNL